MESMKKIGLIGGMSWESSLVYYKLINEKIKAELGGFHSARCVMDSVDFAEIERLQHIGDWERLNQMMAASAKNLENAGADIILLCTNTMHLCTDSIIENTNIPFLHIAEATGRQIQRQGISKILLLGTQFTMEKDFYKTVLNKKFGIETIIPSEADRKIVHDVIYGELVHGILSEKSKKQYVEIIEKSIVNGAQGVILGCTEIPLLIKESDCSIPTFDTTTIHAESAVRYALDQ